MITDQKKTAFTLSFFDNKAHRLLLLNSYSYRLCVEAVIRGYNLPRLSFINVFEGNTFKFRLYVRAGTLSPFVGQTYSLLEDTFLKEQQVAAKPVLCWCNYKLSNLPRPSPDLNFWQAYDQFLRAGPQ